MKKPGCAGPGPRAFSARGVVNSFQMRADQFGHFEHADLILAENRLELGICVDHALVRCVLQIVLLDVFPQFFHHFGARQRRGAHDGGQMRRRGERFHERRAGLTGCFSGGRLFCRGFCSGHIECTPRS